MRSKKIALSLLLSGVVLNTAVLANYNHNNEQADKRIREEVDRTIDQHPNLDKDVSFKVEHGLVTLTGKVDSMAEKNQAQTLVSNVNEVKRVDNQLKIK